MSTGIAYLGDSHAILAACRDLIEAAEESILLQMYLFASDGDLSTLLPRPGSFPYADTVAGWLIEKKRRCPKVSIVVILDSNTPADPRLTRRRGELPRQRMEQAGIPVLTANLFHTRFEPRRRWLPAMNFHLDHGRGPRGSWVARQNRWQALQNVEDHRKNLVIDRGRAGAVLSHNFFDAAHDWHENLLWLSGDGSARLWRVATAALRLALEIPQPPGLSVLEELRRLAAQEPLAAAPLAPTLDPVPGYHGGLRVPLSLPASLPQDPGCELVENEQIRPCLLALLEDAGPGDELLVATTYFSDLPVLEALAGAARRGVRVRILVDSIDALPLPAAPGWIIRNLVNHRVLSRAAALLRERPGSFELRVHDSRAGAMMHLKTAALRGERPWLLGGQANYTPNSFSGAWLETDVRTREPSVIDAFARHFERLWSLPASRPLETLPGGGLGSALKTALLDVFEGVGLRP